MDSRGRQTPRAGRATARAATDTTSTSRPSHREGGHGRDGRRGGARARVNGRRRTWACAAGE
eukprot:3899183-Prymnesium_polylepis.1